MAFCAVSCFFLTDKGTKSEKPSEPQSQPAPSDPKPADTLLAVVQDTTGDVHVKEELEIGNQASVEPQVGFTVL